MAKEQKKISRDDFKEIKITGPNWSRSHKDSRDKSISYYFFALSEKPPQTWTTLFNDAWIARKWNQKSFPDARVDGEDILLICRSDEELQPYVYRLKEDVATANRQYREVLEQAMEAQQEDEEEDEQERLEMQKKLDALEF